MSDTGSPPAVEARSDAEFDTRGIVTTTPLAADVNPSRAELTSKGAMRVDAEGLARDWGQSTLAVAGVFGIVADVDQEPATSLMTMVSRYNGGASYQPAGCPISLTLGEPSHVPIATRGYLLRRRVGWR